MDAQQKAQLEQKAVAALFVVFLAVFFCGPLKGLGLFKAKRPSAEVSAPQPASLPATPRSVEFNFDAAIPPASSPEANRRPFRPTPTLGGESQRDPLRSLLPSEPSVSTRATWSAGSSATALAPPSEAVGASHLSVQGLWWGGPEPKAIINGRVYGLHDAVDGAVITSISREGVELEVGGTTVQLTTPQGSGQATQSQFPRQGRSP